jgi:acetylornithine deacetylase/succinyl-diaminopimelate desuccinylase-like protein
MTREEKTNLLNELLEYEEKNDIGNLTRADRREFQQWISEALEQESILDKIRAEIEQNAYPIVHGVNNHEKGMTLNGIFQVIDKYKGESER